MMMKKRAWGCYEVQKNARSHARTVKLFAQVFISQLLLVRRQRIPALGGAS